MFKKFKVAFGKVHSFLFGEENEHIHTREERKAYYGRLKNDDEIEARMLHQYPKQGKFRFPVIEDEKVLQRHKQSTVHSLELSENEASRTFERKNKPKNDRTLLRSERKLEQKNKLTTPKKEERKKFQGVNFKAREIPSPVYAFTKQSVKIEEVVEDEKKESITYNYPTDQLRDENTYIVESSQIESFELSNDELRKIEIERHELTNDDRTCSKNEVIEIVDVDKCETVDLPRFEEEEAVESQKVHLEIASTTQSDISLRNEPQDIKEKAIVQYEQEQTYPRKTVVPFNVLMLQKDRAAQKRSETKTKDYQFPTLQLLNIPPKKSEDSNQWLEEKRKMLEKTLANFNVDAKVVGVTKGPSVTRFEIQPEAGVKVSKITGLTDDIKLSLAAKDIRIEAPIPGRNAIGIEVPNDVSEAVVLREILRSGQFQSNPSPLTVAMGLDIAGTPIVTDIQKMPHGLIAGSTGSGKSVCINSILISIMFKATPDEVKLMLVDPKMVELAPYNDIPHLVTPVITDAKQATVALKWAVEEMERRYELFVQNGVRDIKRYNEVMKKEDNEPPAMPYIVIVIDELADLMMVSPQDVEEAICRIAQKARACGIHLLVATQRPSVDVITGLIKANIPTRIAFSVSSQADSRTIIDSGGAERLLGKGDMLLFENGTSKPVRIQGNFVSDEEIDRVIALVKQQQKPNYLFDKEHLVKSYEVSDQEDDLFEEACYYVVEQGGASSSSLQRRFRIGFNRAARLIDMMELRGIISEAMGSKPRNVLVTEEELSERI